MRSLFASSLFAAMVTFPVCGFAGDAPHVVTSIKPVHALVSTVMGGVGTPSLIVKGAGSPHGYALRPSEASELSRADLIFWIGPGLETFLEHPLESIADGARKVRLDRSEGLQLLAVREGRQFDAHDHDDDGHDHGGKADEHVDESHEHGDETDMHFWLDPANARAMARTIVSRLSEIDPANAAAYRYNGEALERRIAMIDKRIVDDLSEVGDRPIVVFHDAYQYFEKRYGLRTAASFTVNPEAAPGAKRLAEIRARIAGTGAACVFSEPQFKPRVVASVAGDSGIRSGVLDPLGAEVDPGPRAWEDIMLGLSRSLKSCLASAS